MCDIHQLTIEQLADVVTGEEIEEAARNIRRIAQIRLDIAKAEAEVAAWLRLTDLAGNFPTNPRDRDTSRKAAALILRELKKPAKLGAGGFQPPDRPEGDATDSTDAPTPRRESPDPSALQNTEPDAALPNAPLNPTPIPESNSPAPKEAPPCTQPASASPPTTPPASACCAPKPSAPNPGRSDPPPARTCSNPRNGPATSSPTRATPCSASRT
jgi:hypothetical protein